MCTNCHAIAARRAQRRIRVLVLQRDDAIDQGWAPGPLLLAEIVCQRARQLDAERELSRRGFSLTSDGQLVRPVAL